LKNLDLPTINALFNKKDQFPDLDGRIIVKGTLDGNNLFFNKGGGGGGYTTIKRVLGFVQPFL